jgi:predicted DCC family thiol-disulfide oxidoreductase YuxK
MLAFPEGKKIILFDGFCNLCESSVLFVIKYDKKDIFRFVALQSDLGKEIVKHIGLSTKHIDSVVLYEPGISYFYKSAAAIEIAKNLGGVFHLGTLFRIIPAGLRNLLYDYIAENRYLWYGKKESCLVPTEEIKSKFIE